MMCRENPRRIIVSFPNITGALHWKITKGMHTVGLPGYAVYDFCRLLWLYFGWDFCRRHTFAADYGPGIMASSWIKRVKVDFGAQPCMES